MNVLRMIKEIDPTCRTKSSILVGLGETPAEVFETMRDLRDAQVDLLAIGQYLQPTHLKRHIPLVEYVHPDQFAQYKAAGMKLGFKYIASGPLVRLIQSLGSGASLSQMNFWKRLHASYSRCPPVFPTQRGGTCQGQNAFKICDALCSAR
jgi:lipoate synthase